MKLSCTFFAGAAGPAGLGRPDADALGLIENEVGRTGVDARLTIDTGEELMAVVGVLKLINKSN